MVTPKEVTNASGTIIWYPLTYHEIGKDAGPLVALYIAPATKEDHKGGDDKNTCHDEAGRDGYAHGIVGQPPRAVFQGANIQHYHGNAGGIGGKQEKRSRFRLGRPSVDTRK